MAADPVTPIPGNASQVTTGGEAVQAILGGPNGGTISNPVLASDQGLSVAEDLFVNPLEDATLEGNTTTFRLVPGQSWSVVPGQTTVTSVNALSPGHKFSVFSW